MLYEVFTGKKVFEAATLEELVRLHESSTPPSISSHVKEVDPLVERVILRCLERDPRNRPTSVAQVSAALPGGDPLAAAIAAGETPSPEMVAAAPKEGALRPAVAIACLAAFFIELALVMFLSGRLMYHNNLPLEKSPEVLAYQSSNLIKSFGYADSPADVAYGIWEDTAYYAYTRQRESSFEDWKRLETGQPLLYYFWYRQSPRLMPPTSTKVTLSDPPMDTSGMAKVILDVRGRLVEFYAIPPQVDTMASTAQPDWSAAFTQAGLDMVNFKQVESVWIPPTYADTRIAWEGAYADHADIPIRVEAAAYRGRLVYFHIIPPWEKPTRQEEVSGVASRQAAGFILAAVFFAVIAASVLLARRNLRLGRGDRKGAFKLAVLRIIDAFNRADDRRGSHPRARRGTRHTL